MNRDLEVFKKEVSWFISQEDNIIINNDNHVIELSNLFKKTFPLLTRLISKARVLNLTINTQPYILFSWTDKEENSCGWLNKVEPTNSSKFYLIEEHRLLLNTIGGIQESYNEPYPSLNNNQNFMFIESECSIGIDTWDEYYIELCTDDNIEPSDWNDCICFAVEANGNLTLYNTKSKEVLLFAHDHCFEDVVCLEGQPEYTFYKIENIDNFTDYIESLADSWLARLN